MQTGVYDLRTGLEIVAKRGKTNAGMSTTEWHYVRRVGVTNVLEMAVSEYSNISIGCYNSHKVMYFPETGKVFKTF